MNRLHILIAALLAVILCACSEDKFSPSSGESGNPVSLTLAIKMPGHCHDSRSMTHSDLGSLSLHLFVFDESGSMLQYLRPSDIEKVRVDEKNETAYYRANGIMSGSRRTIHIIASETDDFSTVNSGIASMANEDISMPALISRNGQDAYWARIMVPILNSESSISASLLRNFARLNVVYTGPSDDFELLGFSVVNRPAAGTIVPYLTDGNFFSGFLGIGSEPVGYDDVISSGYHGVTPARIEEDLLCSSPQDIENDINTRSPGTPVCLYERPHSDYTESSAADNSTYVIVKGRYKGTEYYYRLDIGAEKSGRFEFFHILRNFEYTFSISEVSGIGATSISDAMKSPPFNNMSASAATRNLNSITPSGHKIEVSATNVILTSSNPYELRFRYSMTDSETNPGQICVYSLSTETSEANMAGSPKDIEVIEGSVILSAKALAPDEQGWYTIVIVPKEAPATGHLTQSIRIYYKTDGGLGRTVTFIRRNPWTDAEVRHDGNEYVPGLPVAQISTLTSGKMKDNVNIFYHIPAGLGESLFPLDIVFESDKQNIYPHPLAQLTVETLAGSGFDGGTANSVIAFGRRVEWHEYQPSSESGLWLVNPFVYRTTSREDAEYATARIDRGNNPGRIPNSGNTQYAVRVSTVGGHISPVIDNITRNIVLDKIALGWNNTSELSEEMPRPNIWPSNADGAEFTLYYRLPEGLTEDYFGSDGLRVALRFSVPMNLTSELPHGLKKENEYYIQSISYSDYLNNRTFAAPFTIQTATDVFEVELEASGLAKTTGTVKSKLKMRSLDWDEVGYNTNPPMRHDNPETIDMYDGTTLTLYYKLPDNLTEEDFGDEGIKFTLTCSKAYLKYDTGENTPNELSIDTSTHTTATQIVRFDQRGSKIIAPFELLSARVSNQKFTITVSSPVTEDISTDPITRIY